jgi:acetylornithine deacetylase/succinyl-diaminopimelate desuccinylase-like protein
MSEELLYNLDTSYTQRILKNMIRINSIVGHEGELAEYLKVELENLGLKCELHEVEPGRPNVYAKLGIKQRNKRLHFNGHTDTVPAVAWDTDPFNPIVTDEKRWKERFLFQEWSMKRGIVKELKLYFKQIMPRLTPLF